MWPFSANFLPVGTVQPLSADLSECVGATLGGAARVSCLPGLDLGLDHGFDRRDDGLACLWIERSVEADHAIECRGQMQAPHLLLPMRILEAFGTVEGLAPIDGGAAQVLGRERRRGLDQGPLV